ncbi:MAG: glycosyltransferase family 4 protein [Anaerolineales bacterium]|nr:glycosyltransferase family 4 protein [Anaerolineales bacterium]
MPAFIRKMDPRDTASVGENRSSPRLCIVPQVSGVGGMASFQAKMVKALRERGISVCFDLGDETYDGVLLVGGTRKVNGLWGARRRGVPVIQRLDGMNWIHRKRRTGYRHYLRAEKANMLLSFIRKRIATGVIYQSEFVLDWWERVYGPAMKPHWVVHNGVDLNRYSPDGPHDRPDDHYRVLAVEGRFGGGYELGVEHAINLAAEIAKRTTLTIELMIVGQVPASVREWGERTAEIPILWAGVEPTDRIPVVDRSAHLLFAADIHPACPNAVIEAMACGLPVAAFDTGALKELVGAEAGVIVPYGGEPWQLDPPDFSSLAQAAVGVLEDQRRFRAGARSYAEANLGLDKMVDGYLEAFGWT